MRISIIFLLISLCFTVGALAHAAAHAATNAFDEESCNIIQAKACVDNEEKIIDGFPISQCWKYEQKSICESKEQNHCETFENNRGCNEISGNCLEMTPLGNCKHFEKKITCGTKYDENLEVKHVGTDFNMLKGEKDLSTCSEKEKSDYCEFAEEVCVEGAETRNIDGKDIHKDCWKWEKKYICRKAGKNSFIDECSELKTDNKCKEIGRECLYQNIKTGECEHWEVKYQCSYRSIVKKECNKQNLCIGDICKPKQRGQHNDFGGSISYLNILASMKNTELEGCKCPNGQTTCSPNDIDIRQCKFFTGNSGTCRIYHGGQFDCCKDRGIVPDLFRCKEGEKDLFQKKAAGLCHHVDSWVEKDLVLLKEKKQSYCCFKSKMARIIQEQGRAQLGIDFGDKKNPDCRALTLDELKRIDFTKVDFSELFNDFEEKSRASIETKKSEMKDKAGSFKGNPNQELINKKIQNFYRTKGDQ